MTMNFADSGTIRLAKELQELAKDTREPERKRKAAARLAKVLSRPLLLGLFGEFGAGQFTLINNLLRHAACPPELAFGRRPPISIRYAETQAIFAITNSEARSRLTTRGIEQIAQRRLASKDGARVIYKARARSVSGSPEAAIGAKSTLNDDESDGITAIEIQLPLPILSQLEIFELSADQSLRTPPRFSRLPIKRAPHIVAWVTLANGAWKHSEFLTWKSLSTPRSKPALLLVTDNESLSDQSRTRLEARLKDATEAAFQERIYLSLKDAAALMSSGTHISEKDWQATGLPALEATLSALSQRIRTNRLERAKRIMQKLNFKSVPVPLLA